MTKWLLCFLAGAAVAAVTVSAWGAITQDEWLFAAAFLAAIVLCSLGLVVDLTQYALRSWMRERRRQRADDEYFAQVVVALRHYFRHLALCPPRGSLKTRKGDE